MPNLKQESTAIHLVQSSSYNTQCSICLVKYLTKCLNVNTNKALSELWHCPYCVQIIFSYNHFYDDDLYSAVIEDIHA